ncbi:hypothetical protein C3432_07525 [Citrobacter amalonaticus]|uniref:DUF1493 family protein n=1 Tax=Citrobacter amalonaticus TaxID=35703 RepID=A0A2S4RYA8_CITAM|nr:DUF1493 family protein [Citrobacter amalonaticus]POT57783.1 hypothetical protein C3432_07525 [Citrobacter amalonaticus]POT76690.1 hypothetical protein C3436_04300 [Citrobacter amalonaticus]POU65769.1 hypothetical protein C3430_10715 [Citrobacter amalonaticus]POV05926.1 hypothetical protein C3424_11600 [Citrobacter amalonaticus]
MVTDDEVIAWYSERFNKPALFTKKRWPVSINTSLSTGKYVWASETGADIMNEYFERFDVDRAEFDFYRYWPQETFFLYALFTCGGDDNEPEPLTLKMLADSAKAGIWLYG